MVFQVSADRPTTGATHTVPQLCGLLGGTLNGHPVTPPTLFGFPSLGQVGGSVDLGTHATHFLAAGSGPCIVRAVGLLTCASVIYYNNGGDAYVHHANAGVVGQGDFNTAIAALGGAAGNVWVVYAHNNNTDNGYQATLTDIVNWGVPTNQVTEVTNLRVPGFGTNNLGWVGY